MKYKHIPVLALAAWMLLPGLANAEMLSGTIQSIDPGKGQFKLMRNDTQESVTISVKDPSELSSLQAGGQITVDASRKLFGGWETKSAVGQEASAPQPEAAPAASGGEAQPGAAY